MKIKDCCISSVELETGGSLKMKDQTASFFLCLNITKINKTGCFPFQHDKRTNVLDRRKAISAGVVGV